MADTLAVSEIGSSNGVNWFQWFAFYCCCCCLLAAQVKYFELLPVRIGAAVCTTKITSECYIEFFSIRKLEHLSPTQQKWLEINKIPRTIYKSIVMKIQCHRFDLFEMLHTSVGIRPARTASADM